MRLKAFSAASVAEAMRQVRTHLGDEAVIVSVEEARRGKPACVTAALETPVATQPLVEVTLPEPAARSAGQPYTPAMLEALLRYHGVPASLRASLLAAANSAEGDLAERLAQALASALAFRPLAEPLGAGRPVMLVGQPGQGKTLNCARLAGAVAESGQDVRVITLDCQAAGALAQLRAFCQPLDVPVLEARDAGALGALIGLGFEGVTLIDTAGINPYALSDVAELAEQIKVSGAEAIWVMAAGCDPLEAAESARLYHTLGVRRFILSRADAARRYAAPVSAAAHGGLALAAIAHSPFLGDPLEPATPWVLAERLISKPDQNDLARLSTKKAAS